MEVDLSVIVPCFNEEANIKELARRVLRTFERGELEGELVLVDDGSSDRTADIIRQVEGEHPAQVVGRFHPSNRGIAQAWKTGVATARGAVVGLIDADLQYQPEDLLRLYRELREHSVDVIQGWRSPVGRERGSRYHLSRGLNHLLNTTFGMKLQDNKSGFVVCAKEVFEDLLTYRGSYFYWQSFIMVAAHAKGYSYKEVETLFENRRAGTSFLDGNASVTVARSLVDLAGAAWEYRFRHSPKNVSDQFLRRHPAIDRGRPMSAARRLRWNAYLTTFSQTHWMITRDVERYYETLRETQWLKADQVRELQDEKLRRLIRHAYRNVPFYRYRMQAAKLGPSDIRGRRDLHKLPFLTKDDVQENLHFDILSENHDKRQVLRVATSGSTGQPFVCYVDRAQLEFRWAATLRSQEWTGYNFGDPSVRLWHQTIGITQAQALRERLDAALLRRKFIPVFEMSEARLDAMAREIADYKPVLLDGYAEALDFLAYYLKDKGRVDLNPRAIMSSAQSLPLPSRQRIESAFGCKVFDKYGAREFSGIAYECEAHVGHHVAAEGYIVEVLRDGQPAKPGEIGEVVITDLNNYCLPFVRYRIGDLAVAMDPNYECPCGRGLPLVGDIEGRVQSIIQGTDGRFVPGTFFAHLLKEYDHAVQRFQVIQEEREALTFRVVKAGRYTEGALAEILSHFHQHLGDDLRIDVEFVDRIEMVRTGKHLASVSRLGVDFQSNAPRPSEKLQ